MINDLLADVAGLPEDAAVIILGDMNADPFTNKGSNRKLFPTLLACPRLHLIARPDASRHTRPAKESHIDNILCSEHARRLVSSELQYFDFQDIKFTRAKPSDHIPIGLVLKCSSVWGRPRSSVTQVNTLSLREGHNHSYPQTLRALSYRFVTWALNLRRVMTTHRVSTSEAIIETVHEGLLLILRSAAYQTLGTRRVPIGPKPYRYFPPQALTDDSTSNTWKLINDKLLSSRNAPDPPDMRLLNPGT